MCPPHRWRIDEPHGPTVDEVCGKCGAKRTFLASSYQEKGNAWMRTATSPSRSGRARAERDYHGVAS